MPYSSEPTFANVELSSGDDADQDTQQRSKVRRHLKQIQVLRNPFGDAVQQAELPDIAG